ncbi:Uncharacterised protein [Raoultella terrigena]|uniref:Uncharacterized protein n=1 Tax=Raoultella terrigena TaxID=577 RepID=A0A4U9D9N8_RAOTE|nr:Uncharacterised protein [Raoultella terrigena]
MAASKSNKQFTRNLASAGFFYACNFPPPEVTVLVAFFISITTPSVTTEVRDYENA